MILHLMFMEVCACTGTWQGAPTISDIYTGPQNTQTNAIHNECFLAFSMLSHTTLVCSTAQLVCMQDTDFNHVDPSLHLQHIAM